MGRAGRLGAPGLTASLSPGPSEAVIYSSADHNTPDGTLQETAGADVYFRNVAPGEHVVTLQRAGGAALDCRGDPAGVGWTGDEPNTFRIFVDESYLVFGAEVICEMP